MTPFNTEQKGPMPLRPMGFGELLDVGIRTFAKHWGKFITMGLIATLPTMVYLLLSNAFMWRTAGFSKSAEEFLLMDNPFADPWALIGLFSSAIVLWGVTLLLGPLFFGATVHLSSQLLLGRPAAVKDSLMAAWGRFSGLLGTALLKGFLLNVLPLGIIGGAAGWLTFGNLSNTTDAELVGKIFLFIGVFFIALLVMGVLNLFGYLTEQSLLIEALPGGLAPLRRSFGLVGSAFWRSVAMAGILIGISLGISMLLSIIQLPLVFIGMFAESMGVLLGSQLVSGLATMLTVPLTYLLLTLYYYDLRMRKEGFDLELQAAQQAESMAATE